MALNPLPSNLYSAGAVVFDNDRSLNLYAQLMAKKQAKMDALDEYDRRRILDINSKGVRNVDREEFDKQLAEIQRKFSINKDKIRKGNTPEAYEFEQSLRNTDAFINDTKERTAKQEAAMKLYTDVFKKDGIVPELEDGSTFTGDMAANDKPLGAEGSKSFDLPKWVEISAKPFNLQTHLRKYEKIPRTPGVATYTPIPGDKLRETETIEERFGNTAKETIAAMAATDYQTSLGFKRQVDSEFTNPVSRVKLQELFKNEFGVHPETMENYAAAYQLSIMNPVVVKSEPVYSREKTMDKAQRNKERNMGLYYSRYGKGAIAQWPIDAANAAKSGDIETIKNVFGHLHSGNKYKFKDVKVEGDELVVEYDVPFTKRGVTVFMPALEPFRVKISDPQLQKKLAGLYQDIMGATQPIEAWENKPGVKKPTGKTTKAGLPIIK